MRARNELRLLYAHAAQDASFTPHNYCGKKLITFKILSSILVYSQKDAQPAGEGVLVVGCHATCSHFSNGALWSMGHLIACMFRVLRTWKFGPGPGHKLVSTGRGSDLTLKFLSAIFCLLSASFINNEYTLILRLYRSEFNLEGVRDNILNKYILIIQHL